MIRKRWSLILGWKGSVARRWREKLHTQGGQIPPLAPSVCDPGQVPSSPWVSVSICIPNGLRSLLLGVILSFFVCSWSFLPFLKRRRRQGRYSEWSTAPLQSSHPFGLSLTPASPLYQMQALWEGRPFGANFSPLPPLPMAHPCQPQAIMG